MTRSSFYLLILTASLLASACSKTIDGTESGPGGSSTAETGGSSETNSSSSTITVAQTSTVTSTVTQVTTETTTVTEHHTSTETTATTSYQTITATQTLWQTNTSTQTVAVTVTQTVTSTNTSVSLAQGNYQSDRCYLDGPASDQAGQRVYALATLKFTNGNGQKRITYYSDSTCSQDRSQDNISFTYSYAGSLGGLVVFRIDQELEKKPGGPVQRYWLVALESNGDLRFALDATYNQGPFLSEPTEAELSQAATGISEQGVWFRLRN